MEGCKRRQVIPYSYKDILYLNTLKYKVHTHVVHEFQSCGEHVVLRMDGTAEHGSVGC